MRSITIRAPGTIANFGPGFDIFALALERPFIELRIQLAETRGVTIKTDGCKEPIPADPEQNCAGLALIALLKRVGHDSGVIIELEKTISIGAGLGSSGACAAAAVYGLNRLLELNLSANEMIAIASHGEIASGGVAHADNVAGAMLGGFVIVTSYRPINVTKIEVHPIPVVIGVMRKTRRTTRTLIPQSMTLDLIKGQLALCASVVHAIMSGDIEGLGRAINKDFISEPVRSRSIPGYSAIKQGLLDAGAFGCNVSGGGLSIFAICDEAQTRDIAEVMRQAFARENLEVETIITTASNQGIMEVDRG